MAKEHAVEVRRVRLQVEEGLGEGVEGCVGASEEVALVGAAALLGHGSELGRACRSHRRIADRRSLDAPPLLSVE